MFKCCSGEGQAHGEEAVWAARSAILKDPLFKNTEKDALPSPQGKEPMVPDDADKVGSRWSQAVSIKSTTMTRGGFDKNKGFLALWHISMTKSIG